MTITAFGLNTHGQLAASYFNLGHDGPVTCSLLPASTVAVSGGYKGFTVGLLADGTLLALGGGVNGEMGQGGHRSSYYLPVKPAVEGVRAISCAGAHAHALLANGTVASWGGNSFGTNADGTSGFGQEAGGTATPTLALGLSGVKQISAANGVVAALLTDGSVRTWGCGSTGALGVGHVVPLNSLEGATPQSPGIHGVRAVAAGGFQQANHVLALMEDGTVMQWGAKGPCGTTKDVLSPIPVAGLSNIVAVAAGPAQSFAIDTHGDLYAWGNNPYGQLFLPVTVLKQDRPTRVASGISQVGCGLFYSLALTTDGIVLGAGRHDEGQLAGVGLSRVASIAVCEHHAFALGGLPREAPIRASKAPGGGGLGIAWSSPPVTKRWEVSPSTLNGAAGKTLIFDAAIRSCTVPAVAGVTMKVKVRCGTEFSRTVVAVA